MRYQAFLVCLTAPRLRAVPRSRPSPRPRQDRPLSPCQDFRTARSSIRRLPREDLRPALPRQDGTEDLRTVKQTARTRGSRSAVIFCYNKVREIVIVNFAVLSFLRLSTSPRPPYKRPGFQVRFARASACAVPASRAPQLGGARTFLVLRAGSRRTGKCERSESHNKRLTWKNSSPFNFALSDLSIDR